MRAWIAMVAIVAGGCGSGTRTTTSTAPDDDPLAGAEAPLDAETLPGRLAGAWPLELARGAAGWLLPYADGGEVYARFVGDDGARVDRDLDHGTLVGATAVGDGFALAVASGGTVRVHFLAGDGKGGGDRVVTAPLDGTAVPGVASDGSRVLVGATQGGSITAAGDEPLTGSLVLVDGAGALVIDLGAVHAAPTPWGDRDGFIVGGTLLLDGAGNAAPVPGRQVRDARVFRQVFAAGSAPTSDTISLDGTAWRNVGGLVGWAGRSDDDGTALELVGSDGGRAFVEVGQDLTPRVSRVLPSTTRGDGGQAWIAAVAGRHVVWAATVENDPVFAILDATAMRADGGFVRLRGATSRSAVASPGGSSILFAWTEANAVVRYSVLEW